MKASTSIPRLLGLVMALALTGTALAAPPAASPASGAQKVTLNPTYGQPGDAVVAMAMGFAKSEKIRFSFGGKAAGYCTADSSGACSFGFVAPKEPKAEAYTVQGAGETSKSQAKASFTLYLPGMAVHNYVSTPESPVLAWAVGLGKNDTVYWYWDKVFIGTCAAGSIQECEMGFNAPDEPTGNYLLTAVGAPSGLHSSFELQQTQAALLLHPAQGAPGATVKVWGLGFAKGEKVSVTYNGKKVATGTSNGSGSAAITFKVPAGGKPGSYAVTGTGSTSKVAGTSFFNQTK